MIHLNAIAFGRRLAPLCMVVMGVLLLLGTSGCETRVIGVKNSWAGSHWSDRRAEESESDGLAAVGEFLFGWTDGIFGDNNKQENSPFRSVDLDERMNPSRGTSGRGG